jgi:hypothetical protein
MGRGSTAPPAYKEIVSPRPPEALSTPVTVTSLSTSVRVSTTLGSADRPIKTTRPPGSTIPAASDGSSCAVDASRTASKGRSGRVSRSHAAPKPSSRANRSDRSSRPSRCTSAPKDRAICAASSPMVPGPITSSRCPPPASAARTARSALPPGSTRAPMAAPTPAGIGCRALAGTRSCSARAPGQPPRTPISYRSAHRCCRPPRQRRHRPQPSIVSPVTRCPTQDSVAASPARVTTPHHSWPMRTGYCASPVRR